MRCSVSASLFSACVNAAAASFAASRAAVSRWRAACRSSAVDADDADAQRAGRSATAMTMAAVRTRRDEDMSKRWARPAFERSYQRLGPIRTGARSGWSDSLRAPGANAVDGASERGGRAVSAYLPILTMILLVLLFAALSFVASGLLGPRRPTSAKEAPYE